LPLNMSKWLFLKALLPG